MCPGAVQAAAITVQTATATADGHDSLTCPLSPMPHSIARLTSGIKRRSPETGDLAGKPDNLRPISRAHRTYTLADVARLGVAAETVLFCRNGTDGPARSGEASGPASVPARMKSGGTAWTVTLPANAARRILGCGRVGTR